ncbi:major outer membrane protein [Campylobacter sp. RM12654]|uniref:major outer membrane protein n=1 Tax=unclassified Campylobacter TaxID=2593542 RepID=UPI001BDAE602|nr:major outer membrane protein [Campylobacter sp. 2018MI13]MBT0883531.1 major outer membrane protein [Campylobacter sp. 2018MI13]MBZ7978053.1 major outer membrane protein [Campylobacter sp. RM12654]
MKLVKLSLAAVVAAGSFSFANAVALDEAIQNVDLSGMLRYRYETESTKSDVLKTNLSGHKYKAQLKFGADIADNFKATALFQYSNTDGSYGDRAYLQDKNTFFVRDAYLTYTNYDTSFMFGRMEIGSIWTDDLLGTGLKIVNNSIENVTLAAYAFDNYNNDGDLSPVLIGDNDIVTSKNLYGIAAIANFDPVAAQLWVSNMASYGTFYAVDFNVALGDKDDFAYNVHAQYAGNSLKKDRKGEVAANGNFYAAEAGFDAFGLDFNVGYAGYGKKDKLTLNTVEDEGQLINYGEIVMKDYQGGFGKKDFVFGTIGYTFEDVRFGVDIISGTNKVEGAEKEKLFEVKPQLSYKYSDKLNFSAFYAHGTTKQADEKTTDKLIRFQAKYTF